MDTNTKPNTKILSITLGVLYVVLFAWPAYLFMLYMKLTTPVKYLWILFVLTELFIGGFLTMGQFKKEKETVGSKVLFWTVSVSYLLYCVSIIWYISKIIMIAAAA